MIGKFNCEHSSKNDIDQDFWNRMVQLEKEAGIRLTWVSGARCPMCNDRVDGVKKSAHIASESHKCKGSDVYCNDSRHRFLIVKHSVLLGFTRIGIAKTFIHLDIDPDLPQEVIWLY